MDKALRHVSDFFHRIFCRKSKRKRAANKQEGKYLISIQKKAGGSSPSSSKESSVKSSRKKVQIVTVEKTSGSLAYTGGSSKEIVVQVVAEVCEESGSREPMKPRNRALSEGERMLLNTLSTTDNRPRNTGKFLTLHKRRKKRLSTRSLQKDVALLDDVLHGQTQTVLSRGCEWNFNAFHLDYVTGGHALPVLCIHFFYQYGIINYFKMDPVKVWKCFVLIQEGYHSTNPYHNSIHATDVTQAMNCFLREDKICRHITPLERLAALLAAVTHDLDHPGVNQPFLVATSNHLANLYNNASVLENHHWRSAVGCILESGMLDLLPQDDWDRLEDQIRSLILATDITRQQEFLTRFKRYLDNGTLDLTIRSDRHFLLQIALKCADICNPCRPWDISKKWSQKVCEEFFRQGDFERQLGLPVTSLCDRDTTTVPKIQSGFFQFVVAPLFEDWNRCLNTPLSKVMMHHLRVNQKKWDGLLQEEIAEETKTEISDADDVQQEVESSDEEEDKRREEEEEQLESVQSQSRRHSVPLNFPRTVSRTVIRRESLPSVQGRKAFETVLKVSEGSESCYSLYSMTSGLPIGGCHHGSSNADKLLPELSITSISDTMSARHISSFRSTARPGLTRQQTFPAAAESPPGGFIRSRYFSIATGLRPETLPELSTSSEESNSEPATPKCANGKQCGTPPGCINGKGCGTPPGPNAQSVTFPPSCTPSTDSQGGSVQKRESDCHVVRVAKKFPKIELRSKSLETEKENLLLSAEQRAAYFHSLTQGQSRLEGRRGSEPFSTPPYKEEIVPVSQERRGSAPLANTHLGVLRNLQAQENARLGAGRLTRRGSLPTRLRKRGSLGHAGPEPFIAIAQGSDSDGNSELNIGIVPLWDTGECYYDDTGYGIWIPKRRASVPVAREKVEYGQRKDGGASNKPKVARRGSGGLEILRAQIPRGHGPRESSVTRKQSDSITVRRGSAQDPMLSTTVFDHSARS